MTICFSSSLVSFLCPLWRTLTHDARVVVRVKRKTHSAYLAMVTNPVSFEKWIVTGGSSGAAEIILKISRTRATAGLAPPPMESFQRFASFVFQVRSLHFSAGPDTPSALAGDRAILTAITYVSLHVYSVSILIMNEAVAYTASRLVSFVRNSRMISLPLGRLDPSSLSLLSSPPTARLLCAYFISFSVPWKKYRSSCRCNAIAPRRSSIFPAHTRESRIMQNSESRDNFPLLYSRR